MPGAKWSDRTGSKRAWHLAALLIQLPMQTLTQRNASGPSWHPSVQWACSGHWQGRSCPWRTAPGRTGITTAAHWGAVHCQDCPVTRRFQDRSCSFFHFNFHSRNPHCIQHGHLRLFSTLELPCLVPFLPETTHYSQNTIDSVLVVERGSTAPTHRAFFPFRRLLADFTRYLVR